MKLLVAKAGAFTVAFVLLSWMVRSSSRLLEPVPWTWHLWSAAALFPASFLIFWAQARYLSPWLEERRRGLLRRLESRWPAWFLESEIPPEVFDLLQEAKKAARRGGSPREYPSPSVLGNPAAGHESDPIAWLERQLRKLRGREEQETHRSALLYGILLGQWAVHLAGGRWVRRESVLAVAVGPDLFHPIGQVLTFLEGDDAAAPRVFLLAADRAARSDGIEGWLRPGEGGTVLVEPGAAEKHPPG